LLPLKFSFRLCSWTKSLARFVSYFFVSSAYQKVKPDTKADVYSFGLLLWNILTEESPNEYDNIVEAVVFDKQRPPREGTSNNPHSFLISITKRLQS
jgi:hypothetical protein